MLVSNIKTSSNASRLRMPASIRPRVSTRIGIGAETCGQGPSSRPLSGMCREAPFQVLAIESPVKSLHGVEVPSDPSLRWVLRFLLVGAQSAVGSLFLLPISSLCTPIYMRYSKVGTSNNSNIIHLINVAARSSVSSFIF